MINHKTAKVGDIFWSHDWGQAWHAKIALISSENVAHFVQGGEQKTEIKTVRLIDCYATEAEVWDALAEDATQKAAQAHRDALHRMDKAKLAREAARLNPAFAPAPPAA